MNDKQHENLSHEAGHRLRTLADVMRIHPTPRRDFVAQELEDAADLLMEVKAHPESESTSPVDFYPWLKCCTDAQYRWKDRQGYIHFSNSAGISIDTAMRWLNVGARLSGATEPPFTGLYRYYPNSDEIY